jgi:hypothetical protein
MVDLWIANIHVKQKILLGFALGADSVNCGACG